MRYADVVQSLDRPKLALALDRGGRAGGRALWTSSCRSGSTPPATGAASRPPTWPGSPTSSPGSTTCACAGSWPSRPLGEPPRPAFARLRELSERLRTEHPAATWISAGMSADLEDAVAEGATHLRVGSAILGSRESHR